jgi:hypothetical protein
MIFPFRQTEKPTSTWVGLVVLTIFDNENYLAALGLAVSGAESLLISFVSRDLSRAALFAWIKCLAAD